MVTFRKSKSVGPFRFTLSNRGLSTSVGGGPIRISRSADGKLRRTIRVPGLGLSDTKAIGQPAKSTTDVLSDRHSYTEAPLPRRRRRIWPWLVGALLFFWTLGTIGSCNGRQNDAHSTVTTVTKTVTAAPLSAFAAVPPTTVAVVAEAPPPVTVTVAQAATPPADYQAPPAAPVPAPIYPSTVSSGSYYSSCSEARAAGAAPLRRGEPGYRSGLDRDDDGVACE
jgi:hypothetical protein